jgi:L-cysteate sulfo-lyase
VHHREAIMVTTLSRVSLAHLPTPLQPLERLSQALGGPQLWIKRDDLTGLALGGNKTRKLEFLMGEALHRQAQTVITAGSVQSNHARQTAAAAARCGLRCILVLSPMAPPQTEGNLFLDHLLGAQIRWSGDRDRAEMMQQIADEERLAGRTPYIIPYGGSNALGAAAYFDAMHEMVRQSRQAQVEFESVVMASSSGGTQSGLVAGSAAIHYAGRILGISVDEPADVLAQRVRRLARLTIEYLNVHVEVPDDMATVIDDYVGEGYAIMGEPEREAIQMLARYEGILLDPVYTGKAMAGLIDLIRTKRWRRNQAVLFWHTGGAPALFAYRDRLLRE